MEASAAPAATYERSVEASVPRIGENVLDGEHLPVECGWHGYRFDLRDGRCDRSASLRLRSLPRIVVDDESGIVSLHW